MKTKFVSLALLFSSGVTFSLLLPQALLAEESSCHDYPGHGEVLNEGYRQIHGGSHRSTLNPRIGIDNGVERLSFPKSVESCVENIKSAKKNNQEHWVRESIERYADHYFWERKYGDCQEFLESVLNELEPVERYEYYDVIAVCYLLKDQKRELKSKSNYLEELIDLVDQKSVITEKTKFNLVKVSEYVNKATDAQKDPVFQKDPEVTLRMGLLNLVLGKKEEAVRFNDKVVANFRRDIIFAPKSIMSDAMKIGLEKLFQRNPDRYLSEEQAIAFAKGKELMLSGAVSLTRKVGSNEDIIVVAIKWIKEMPQAILAANKQELLIGSLPENFRGSFSKKDYIIACSDFTRVFDVLKKRGWIEEAIAFKRGFFAEGFTSSTRPGVEQISRYYLAKGDRKSALSVYKEALKPISELNNKNTSDLLIAYARITPLYEDLTKYKVDESDPVVEQTKALYASVKHNYDVHKCLELAEELTQTGWKLVDQGDSRAALKLYKSALEIREKNLPSNSRILASTYMDAGRAAALHNDVPFAEKCFKRTLKIINLNPIPNDEDLKITVESYGSLLNKNNRYDEAQKIFALLKAVQ
jgi:tetratricopeptide (TPR) repeat protein